MEMEVWGSASQDRADFEGLGFDGPPKIGSPFSGGPLNKARGVYGNYQRPRVVECL